MAVKIGSYKGNATITLNPESKWPFSFGVAKAQMILENIEAIRTFVVTHGGIKKVRSEAGDGGYSSGLDDRVADQYAEQCGLNGQGR